ncbi:uncharacterized protein LOC105841152 [Monomorium pharaonis]|uniref:uncharacterized protein LOC105841152 n=1 Tax=Monomorium pharaonis TaxID=307658 RepID=UPI00063EE2B7|nr:uncharacterized protein LOC105841152 [Monomorium pharaonis]
MLVEYIGPTEKAAITAFGFLSEFEVEDNSSEKETEPRNGRKQQMLPPLHAGREEWGSPLRGPVCCVCVCASGTRKCGQPCCRCRLARCREREQLNWHRCLAPSSRSVRSSVSPLQCSETFGRVLVGLHSA